MRRKILSALCALALMLGLVGCAEEAEETTTLTGMVVAVDGTVISIMEVGSGDRDMSQRPTMPEGEMPSMPEGEMPSMPEGEMPSMPEGEMPSMPEGEMPSMPEGEKPSMPEGGQEDREFDTADGTKVDLTNAHITVEFDGGKATGSMEDITVGAYVTVTLNSKGECTNIVVSENTGFGGGKGGNRGEFGGQGDGSFGGRGEQGSGFDQMPVNSTDPTV